MSEAEEHLRIALVALQAAHDEEGVCSCPWDDGCVLRRPWARRALASPAELIEAFLEEAR